MDKDKNALEELVKQCISLTSKQGKTISQGGSLLCAWMTLQHIDKDVASFLELVYFPFTHSYCSLTVQEKGVVVLKASGKYAPVPYDLKVHTYQSGRWEARMFV